MRLLGCWIKQTLRGVRSSLLVQLASTGAMAVGLVLVGLAILSASNVDRLTQRWGRGIGVVAYLKPSTAPARAEALCQVLRGRPEVLSVHYVSSAAAFERLGESLGGRRGLLEGVETDFFPSSIEIRLGTDPDQARPLLGFLNASPLIEEVDQMGAWVRRLGALAGLLRLAGLGLALVVGLACLYIVASTIRLGVYARREEIEILKLVGATNAFVRVPFLLEGVLQGLLGAGIAVGILYLAFRGVAPQIEELLSSALTRAPLQFFAPAQLAVGAAIAAAIGLLGSRLALGRYLRV